MFSDVDKETEKLFMDSLLALGMMRYPYYHHSQMFIRRGNKKLMDFSAYNLSELMFKVNTVKLIFCNASFYVFFSGNG
jgi:hypothetical protein